MLPSTVGPWALPARLLACLLQQYIAGSMQACTVCMYVVVMLCHARTELWFGLDCRNNNDDELLRQLNRFFFFCMTLSLAVMSIWESIESRYFGTFIAIVLQHVFMNNNMITSLFHHTLPRQLSKSIVAEPRSAVWR